MTDRRKGSENRLGKREKKKVEIKNKDIRK